VKVWLNYRACSAESGTLQKCLFMATLKCCRFFILKEIYIMGTMTLVEFKLRTRDQLIAGIVEDIYTTNPIYAFMPWIGFAGSGVSVNREETLGDAQFLAIGGTITAKAASAVDQVIFEPTTCIGDAEINELQIAMSGSDVNDVVATEISSKAKSVGRKIQLGVATGDGSSPNMNSMHSMIDSGQYATGGALTFDMLDELIDLVKSKDGQVDWMQANGRDIRAYRALCRKLGGVPMMEVKLGNRTIQVEEFNGIPMFQNDYLSVTETASGAALTTGVLSSMYAGVWDDGTKKVGAGIIYPEAIPAGISYKPIGEKETADEMIHRVKAYMNFAIFNKKGIARLTDLTGAAGSI
jgi:hypothetical protein